MKITQDVREYAAQKEIDEHLGVVMKEKFGGVRGEWWGDLSLSEVRVGRLTAFVADQFTPASITTVAF